MPDNSQENATSQSETNTEIKIDKLVQSLRRKEGNWVSWGQSCQQLQKAGHTPQSIFEDTGFEPIHQNQVIVGAQVYTTLQTAQVSNDLLAHYEIKGSDILYELRILNQAERAAAAELIMEKKLDVDEAKEIAKAIKEFSLLGKAPPEFTEASGDIVAYRCWKLARQQEDLQERSRLIARGLRFASTKSARQAIEDLLTDFSIAKEEQAPPLPIYRLESETELPKILPSLGKLPLPLEKMNHMAPVKAIGPFQQIQSQGSMTWVAIPGWQVILQAQDAVTFLCDSERLPSPLPDQAQEEILIVVDRSQQDWDRNSYFVIATEQQLDLQWFAQEPNCELLGRVILVLRPKKILDEDYTKELWQIDE